MKTASPQVNSDGSTTWRKSDLASADTGEWDRIVREVSANPSLSAEWLTIVAESHDLRPQIAEMAHRNDADRSVVPFVIGTSRQFGLPLKTFDLLSNVAAYHNDIVSTASGSDALDAMLDLAGSQRADLVRLQSIVDQSPLSTALRDPAVARRYTIFTLPGDVSPYIPISGTYDDLLASKPKKFRYKARKRKEQLDKDAELKMQWYAEPQQCPDLMQAIKSIEENSWKLAAGHAIHARPEEKQYYETLLPNLSDNNRLIANVLWKGDTPIAYNLCCHWGTWVGQLKTSFDMRFQSISPGMTVIDVAIERAHELGAAEFDFLGDADQHKLGWSKSTRSHTDYFLYSRNSAKARIVATLKSLRN